MPEVAGWSDRINSRGRRSGYPCARPLSEWTSQWASNGMEWQILVIGAPEVGLEPSTLRLIARGKACGTYIINDIARFSHDNSESLWRTGGVNPRPIQSGTKTGATVWCIFGRNALTRLGGYHQSIRLEPTLRAHMSSQMSYNELRGNWHDCT